MLRAIAAVSAVYDTSIGLVLLLAPGLMATWFGVALPHPPIFSDLNALFLISIGIGYVFAWRDPRAGRWYMWVMGPALKGAGAAAFLLDYAYRHSPPSFLLFAAGDGTLALLTLVALVSSRSTPAGLRR